MADFEKLIMIPSALADKINPQTPIRGVSGVISKLDTDMESILKAKNISAEQKWRQYSVALGKYMHFLEDTKRPLAIPVMSTTSPVTPEKDEEFRDSRDEIRDELLRIVPPTFKEKVGHIYDRLLTPHAQQVIRWDDRCVVSIKGQELKNSNIMDLISDVARDRKTFNPPGWQSFAKILAEIHFPLELIRNPKYTKFIVAQRGKGVTPVRHIATHHATPRKAKKGRANPRRATPRRATPRHAKPKKAGRSPFVKWERWNI